MQQVYSFNSCYGNIVTGEQRRCWPSLQILHSCCVQLVRCRGDGCVFYTWPHSRGWKKKKKITEKLVQTFCSELHFSLMQFEDGCIVPNFITLNSVQISPLSSLGGAEMVRQCWWNIKTDFFWLMSQAEALLWNNCSSNPTEQWINTALKLQMIIRCRNGAFD